MNDKILLWTEVFGDSVDTAKEFFACRGIITLSEYIEDRLASMASLIRIKTDTLSGFYIYGVCVVKELRGRGLFRSIMGRCETCAREEGADFVCLIPANEKLARTYQRLGYNKEILPYNTEKQGNVFICLEDFAEFATPSSDGVCNNGICGLAKPLKDGVLLPDNLLFADFMGDI